jgi:tRNA (guanine37-N1)-methyltransferase
VSFRVDVLTIFPGYFDGPVRESLLGRAVERGLVEVRLLDLRNFTHDAHRSVDDYAFGGGPGMVLRPGPVVEAVESLGPDPGNVLLLSPGGRRFDQSMARDLAARPGLVLICGRYEGVDERVLQATSAVEVSIGDYVLAGGEAAALVVLETVTRLLPGVVGNEESLDAESFERGVLDHPHYTRPRDFRGLAVPEILLSGNHAAIADWRRQAALDKTRRNRPDLLPGEDGD